MGITEGSGKSFLAIGSCDRLAGHVSKVIHQVIQGLIEVLVAIAQQNGRDNVLRENPESNARSRIQYHQAELRVGDRTTGDRGLSPASGDVLAYEGVDEAYLEHQVRFCGTTRELVSSPAF